MIQATSGKLHWNYFLALERDLEVLSRYVEFCEPNFGVFSIELAHLLFAAASEVDVVAKLLCEKVQQGAHCENITAYRAVLTQHVPELANTEVFIDRYGLTLKPWSNWTGTENPDWWRSYNKVKHERDAHFHEATLKNVFNALGALLIITCLYYSFALAPTNDARLRPRETMLQLQPESSLLSLKKDHYFGRVARLGG